MSTDRDAMMSRMAVAKMVQDDYDANPPNVEEWVRALRGCAELFQIAATHLEADPPNFGEAHRCIDGATRMGMDLGPQVRMAYILSGTATEDLLTRIRTELKDDSPTKGATSE